MKRLISKGELARRVTCNRSYVYAQCKEGCKLHGALVGSQVNLDHPDAAHFCASYGYTEPDGAVIAQEVRSKSTKPRRAPPAAPPVDLEPPDVDDIAAGDLLEMPLREVVARFGTASNLKDFVSVVKNLVQTRGYEEEQARKRGEYIHRVHAEQLIVHIDGLQKALLSDTIKNMASRAIAQAAAGAPRQEVEEAMRKVISRQIKATKEQTQRRLRDV